MPILFPPKEHVTLSAPPLAEVICQVRFAPMLRIAEGLPSAYQELLRGRFPKFARRDPLRVEVKGVSTSLGLPLPNEFVCETADEKSSAALGIDFVALSTTNYSHWGSYLADLRLILEAFVKVYGEILSTRIGLRYTNDLRFENTKANSLEELVRFINPDLTCFYSGSMWTPAKSVASRILMTEDRDQLAFRIVIESAPVARAILDYDCYIEFNNPVQMKVEEIITLVSRYHEIIYNAFSWSLREEKMQAFQPHT